MGCCHIQIIKNTSNLFTIIIPRGKHHYKQLPIGFASSPEIFQHKIYDLFHGFEFIRAYVYDLLVLTKGYWADNVQEL